MFSTSHFSLNSPIFALYSSLGLYFSVKKYNSIEPGSILMYYLTEKYNPTDELRAPVGEFGEIWQRENK